MAEWYNFRKGKSNNAEQKKDSNPFSPSQGKEEQENTYYIEEEMENPAYGTPISPELVAEIAPKEIEKFVCENEVVIHETDRIINALRQSIENQQAIYSLLEDQLRISNEQLRLAKEENARLTEIIRKQHETLSTFQKDVFYRSQKDVIMEIIRIADEVEAIRETTIKDSEIDTEMKNLAKFIDDSLVFSAVRSFREADGIKKDVNLKKQEISEVIIPTNQPGKDGVLVSLRPGYIWRLPWLVANTDVQLANMIKDNKASQTYEVLIRPEVVGVMRYEEPVKPNDSYTNDLPLEDSNNKVD